MTPEGRIKRAIRRTLDAAGAAYFMPVPTGYGRRGVSDFIVCHRGRFLAVEAKAPGGRPTPHQEQFLAVIGEAGGKGMIVDDEEMLELKKWLEGE